VASPSIRAIVDFAATAGRDWLVAERNRVLAEYIAGAVEVDAVSFEGASASGRRRVSAEKLLSELQTALDEFDLSSARPGVAFIDYSGADIQS